MILELHEPDGGDVPVAVIEEIESVKQAENWIKITFFQDYVTHVFRWELKSGSRVVRAWERPAGSSGLPEVADS